MVAVYVSVKFLQPHVSPPFPVAPIQTDMVIKEGRYRIDLDVLLFPWRLTYKAPGPGHVPKGSFGKVHLAQDIKTRKRMACKRVSSCSARNLFAVCQSFAFSLPLV